MLCAGSNDQWHRICKLIGRPELANDPRYATPTDRVRHNHEVDALMDAWASTRTVEECVADLNTVSLPCGPVITVQDLLKDESLNYRGMIRTLKDPQTKADLAMPGPVIKGSLSTSIPAGHIPAVDADRAAIRALRGGERPKAAAAASTKHALDGLRVLEIGQYTTAPLTSRQMGAFGADVVKIEPAAGEPARALPPHRDGQSYFFTLSNSDKRAIAIDFRKDDEKALFAELIKKADVLVENLKPARSSASASVRTNWPGSIRGWSIAPSAASARIRHTTTGLAWTPRSRACRAS